MYTILYTSLCTGERLSTVRGMADVLCGVAMDDALWMDGCALFSSDCKECPCGVWSEREREKFARTWTWVIDVLLMV